MGKTIKRLAFLMLMLPFVACEESNYETDEFVGKKSITQLSTDNFLTFASFEELAKKVEEISNMTYEEQIKEEESKGFVSIDRIYEEITLAEEELLKPYEDLTIEELKQVFNNNEKLQDDILQAAQDDVDYWISEYMNCFERGALVYNIGYPGNYIKIKNSYEFIQGLKQLQEEYCYLSEDGEKNIKYCDHLMSRHNNLPFDDYINAERLENRIDEITEELKNDFLKQLVNEYNYYYDTKNLCDYFVEMYADNMTGQYYIDDNYILYQHIEYEKCYK